MQQPKLETIALGDVVITQELSRRSPRAANFPAENQAMRVLAQQMVNATELMLQTLVKTALELCQADSAGVSLLATIDGKEVFGSHQLAGRLTQFAVEAIPRDFSPCGICLDRRTPQLFSYPERYFTYLQDPQIPIVEALLLPLIAEDRPLGAIWIMAHDEKRHFDAEDVRLMTSLADFTGAALLVKGRQTQELLTANAHLETAKERNRVALEAAAIGTWDWNLCTNTVTWNEQHYRILGLEPAPGEEPAELFTCSVHPDDIASVWQQLESAIAQNSIYQAEFQIIRADNGEVRWMSGYGRVVGIKNGKATRMAGVMYDATHRHQTEAALRASEAQFRAIASLVPDLLWLGDSSGKTIWYNQRWLDYTGQTLTEAQGYGWSEVIHPSDRAQSLANFRRAVDERRPWQQEQRIRGKDGNYRWFQIQANPVFDADGQIAQWVGAAIDIHEQRMAHEALRESEKRLRAIVESLPGGAAFIVDRNLRYLLAEGEALAVAGFTSEDFVGRTIFEVLPPELLPSYAALYRQGLAGETFELEHNARDRAYISRGTPLHSATGEIYAVLAVSYDITARKQGEAALRESEARFRLFVTASSDIVYRMSADWHQMHSLDGKNILADTERPSATWLQRYIPQEQQPHVWAAIQEAIRTKSIFELAHRVIQQDGTIGWAFSRAIPILNKQGEILEWFGVASDVTDRKKAEASLKESEAKYRLLFQSIDEGYAVVEVMADDNGEWNDFLFVEVNFAFEQQTGMVNSVGRKATEILGTPNPAWAQIYGRVAQTGEPLRFEQKEETLDRIFDLYAFRLGEAGSRRVAVLFRDITDRKRTEAQLRRAAQMDAFRVNLSDALRSLTDPVEIQAEACRLLGEQLGVDRAYYVEVNEAEGYWRVNQNYLRGDSPTLVGIGRLTEFGWTLPFLCRGEAIVTVDVERADHIPEADRAAMAAMNMSAHITMPLLKGTLVGALCVTESAPREWLATEVELVRETAERIWATIERERAEAALRESELQRVCEQSAREQERQRAETLAELDRAKTTFFSNVSHEFRTPLTLLLAPLQDALSDRTFPLPPPQQERIELARRNSLRLLKLVNTLLDFSRIEAGRIEAVYEPTDLATFTTELASVFRSGIEQAGIRLVVDCPPLSELVYIDRQMWEKIVFNLLSNAFKFTFAGEIAVRLHLTDGERVMLQIQDTGIGIEPENVPYLFDRFYQVRGAKGRTYEGSGIGLALAYELVKLHGGTIDVNSTVGQGSCFTITLPLGTAHLQSDRLKRVVNDAPTETLGDSTSSTAFNAAPYVAEVERWLPDRSRKAEGDPPESSLSSLSVPSPARVLIVDDNADMRDYLTRILSQYVQVEAVADGALALAAVEAQVPDLILADVMMPQLDGFELLYALRANPRTREIPTILLSARAGEESIVEGLQAGADDYLIKPFSALELISRVNNHLQMAKLRSVALQQERTNSQRKDELLSIVSHELNTPLVSILGWTRLLRRVPPSSAMLMKSLETIERNAELQAKLIADLLDISRITAGKLRLSLEPVQLASIIASAIATVSQIAQAKVIDLIWQPTIDPDETNSLVVMGDRDRLEQIICNLLTNAIKFTPQSGSVTIELLIDATYVQIRVTDTGVGIAADFLPYVFDRFRQATVTDATGLGLGLAIARHLVELHNGTICAESVGVGHGATFVVRLPRVQQ